MIDARRPPLVQRNERRGLPARCFPVIAKPICPENFLRYLPTYIYNSHGKITFWLDRRASGTTQPPKQSSQERPSMLKVRLYVVLFAAAMIIIPVAQAQTPPVSQSSPEQTQLLKNTEAFVRNLFAWGPDYAVKLGPLASSPSPDFYQVPLTVTIHEQSDTGTVFVSKDGKTFLRGEMFNMAADPYAENVKKLHLDGNPSIGPANAKVTIVEFSDFQCPHCRELYEGLKTLLPEHPDVRFVFKDYPLTQIHPWAETAAIGARCAYIQNPDAFWPVYSQIFDNQDLLSAENIWEKLNEFAAQANLDKDNFKSCLASKEAKDAVENNHREGDTLNVNSTPTVFINGRPVAGGDKSTITQYLTYESSHQTPARPQSPTYK
jgi:protein-disulfide isomerase